MLYYVICTLFEQVWLNRCRHRSKDLVGLEWIDFVALLRCTLQAKLEIRFEGPNNFFAALTNCRLHHFVVQRNFKRKTFSNTPCTKQIKITTTKPFLPNIKRKYDFCSIKVIPSQNLHKTTIFHRSPRSTRRHEQTVCCLPRLHLYYTCCNPRNRFDDLCNHLPRVSVPVKRNVTI